MTFDLNGSGTQAALQNDRRHRRFVIQVAVALNGLSWLAMWIILGDFGNGNKGIDYFAWSFVAAEAFAVAGWFGIGYDFTRSTAAAGRIARLAAMAHGAWFALPFVLLYVGVMLLDFARVVGGIFLLAMVLAGPIGALVVCFRTAGTIAALCDVSAGDRA